MKIKPWIKIKVGDQDEVDPTQVIRGLHFLDDSSSPSLTNNYTETAGIDGAVFNNASYSKNINNANFWLHFSDYYDFTLAKHDIYRMFMCKYIMRIRTNAEPAIVKFVRAGNFDITPWEKGAHDALFTIPFDNPSGLKYSYANSDVLKKYDQEAWQLGQNLPNGKDLQYQFMDQSQLSVYNASDIIVDPYFQRHELKIIIKHNGGGFTLTNKTTGDVWSFNGSMTSNDTLMIDGINTYKNDKLVDNQTNYGYLSLATGFNDIRVTGASDLDITFSFPFIYLS